MDYYFKHNLIEEDFSVCISSIFNMVTYGEGTIAKAENIILYNYSEIKDNIICNALEINLMNRDVIFMDPLYIHGIGIGGKEKAINKILINNLFKDCVLKYEEFETIKDDKDFIRMLSKFNVRSK